MKRKFYLGTLLILACQLGFSQELFVDSYIEKTKVSPKMGIQIGYELPGGFIVGGFYQQEVSLPSNQEVNRPRFYEKEFYGVALGANLVSWKGLDAYLNVRTGVVNKINFAITPSVTVDYELVKLIHLKAGVGMRSFSPTLMGGISIHLF